MGHAAKVNRDRKRLDATAPTPTVAIAYIHPDQVSAYFTESLIQSVLVGYGQGWLANVLQEWSSANVSAARNKVTQRFLDSGAGDWLLWVDADMQWDHDAIPALLASADAETRPIVGGLCFGNHQGELYPTIYHLVKREDGEVKVGRPRVYERDAMVDVVATGAAFLLVHRRVLEAMAAAKFSEAFPFFMEAIFGSDPVGEDLEFCFRARRLGFPIYVNTSVRIGHHKSHLLTEEAFMAEQGAHLPPGVGLVIPTRGDHPELLRAIVATSGLPPERVVVVDTSLSGCESICDDESPLDVPGATVLVDYGPINIHRWWNLGIDHLAAAGCTRVAVLNDDVSIAPDTLPKLARGMGPATLAVLRDPLSASGHCWMLNVTHGVRPDESYAWWCGDLQLHADASAAGGVVEVDAWCLHLHPNAATSSSPALTALAEADGALYDSRHPKGSRFARITPKE